MKKLKCPKIDDANVHCFSFTKHRNKSNDDYANVAISISFIHVFDVSSLLSVTRHLFAFSFALCAMHESTGTLTHVSPHIHLETSRHRSSASINVKSSNCQIKKVKKKKFDHFRDLNRNFIRKNLQVPNCGCRLHTFNLQFHLLTQNTELDLNSHQMFAFFAIYLGR